MLMGHVNGVNCILCKILDSVLNYYFNQNFFNSGQESQDALKSSFSLPAWAKNMIEMQSALKDAVVFFLFQSS